MFAITSPLPQFFDTDGSPLQAGYVWIGETGENPEASPADVYWDAAGTQAAAQPLRTLGGYIANAGAVAAVYVAGDFSIAVRNEAGVLVYSLQATSRLADDEVTTAKIAATGVTAGTYPKVTVNAKGQVTGGQALASSDVTSALGYTPPAPTGTGASGTWGISISGNAATATEATTATTATTSNKLQTASGDAPVYGARAWVNFDGTGATGTNMTIRASGNVASVLKNGTGDYTITFQTAMPDANYAVTGANERSVSTGVGDFDVYPGGRLADSVRIKTSNGAGTIEDSPGVFAVIFR